MDSRFKKILFNHDQIVERIKEMAEEINGIYRDSKTLVLVGLMKGSIPFMAELMKHIKVDIKIDFMTLASYHGGVESSGNVKIITDLAHDIKGKDILIVEDIVDSGLTLMTVIKMLKDRNPNSIKTIVLLDKPEKRKHNYKPDLAGFVIGDLFVAGFGLDVAGKLRNLPYIGVFDKSKLHEV